MITKVEELGQHLSDHIKQQKASEAFKRSECYCEWEECSRAQAPLKSEYNLVHHLRYEMHI